MARITAPAFVVALINELVIWYENHAATNPLSYPSSAVEAQLGLGRGSAARSLVPLDSLPEHLKPVDRALKEMPDEMSVALYWRHCGGYDDYKHETGLSRATWYIHCDAAYWYLAGAVNNQMSEAQSSTKSDILNAIKHQTP